MERAKAIKRVTNLMKHAKLCMFSTVNQEGQIVSRPMGLQQAEFDGDLWFFTSGESEKAKELQAFPEVNVAFSDHQSWVSLAGSAKIVNNQQKAKELWHDSLNDWFPDGLKTKGLRLIKVHAESAQYWDTTTNELVNLFGNAKAAENASKARRRNKVLAHA